MANYNRDGKSHTVDLLQKLVSDVKLLQRDVTAIYLVPTKITTNYTVLETDDWIINNKAATICTLTLLDPTLYSGHLIKINTWQAFGVQSNANNVIPQAGGAAGSAILTTTAGKWAILISDGTNWIIVQSN